LTLEKPGLKLFKTSERKSLFESRPSPTNSPLVPKGFEDFTFIVFGFEVCMSWDFGREA
jgi:hypothetical protein